jgi:hypothetical protein
MISREETKARFGYWPEELAPRSSKRIVYLCAMCRAACETQRSNYKEGTKCKACLHKIKITKAELAEDIRRVIKELGHQPTCTEYKEFGKYGLTTMTRRFGMGWNDILESLGLLPQRKPYTFDQVCKEVRSVKAEIQRYSTPICSKTRLW